MNLNANDSGKMIVNFLLIIIGVIGMVWLSTQATSETQSQANILGSMSVFGLIIIPCTILLYLAIDRKSWAGFIAAIIVYGFGMHYAQVLRNFVSTTYVSLYEMTLTMSS